ncbi:MAG: alpha/beta hydrolase fold domain-containing protein, partial [Planctomycetota bacterium]|nr:alpha/beta hydrolase fold domain-containing protein [Planctomycetota bacterium]
MQRLVPIVLALALLIPAVPAQAEETGPRTLTDLVYAKVGERELRLDLYLPAASEAKPPLLLWVHGGGWRRGNKKNNQFRWLVPEGYAVASIEYRLTDEAIFPAQIHDVKGALRWLRANAATYGFDATRVGIGGSSAGGHLAALMGTSGGVKALEGTVGGNLDQSSRVQAVYDQFGPAELLTMRTNPDGTPAPFTKQGAVGALVDGDEALARQASPTTHVTADDPPFLIAHGDRDRLVPLAQSETLARLLDAAEVPAELMVRKRAGHGGRAFNAPDLRAAIKAFFAKHVRGEAVTTPTVEAPAAAAPTTGTSPEVARLAAAGRYTVKQVSLALTDETRGKTLDVRVTYPTEKAAFPVIVWSHGLGGSKDAYGPLVEHWTSRGYVVVQATHSDSRFLPRADRARGFSDWKNRPLDVRFLLDQLETLGSRLEGFTGTIDTKRIGMGGHSYGAHTTMLVGGGATVGAEGRTVHGDARPKAFFVLSGQGKGELFDETTWEGITRPMYVLTGTLDTGRGGRPFTWRTDPYTYAPKGDKYLTIIEGARHSFGGVSGNPA